VSFMRLAPAIFLCFLLVQGCFPAGNATRPIEFYVLEYASPAPKGAQVDAAVKVDRFSAGRLYDSAAMVYRPESYKVASYNYHKWRASPGDMVSDYLARDFQNSGLFRAVFSYHQPEAARFVVGGTVEEFAETRENGAWKSRLGLRVTLLDRSRAALTEQVVVQKDYTVSEAMGGESPEAFAAGMSAAMAGASAEIIADVFSAISRRLTEEGPQH
jgi:ABC-type uncharacterized transport system auxiliary subunit